MGVRTLGKCGCGCLTFILIWSVIIPTVSEVSKLTKATKVRREERVKKRKIAEAEQAEAKRLADDRKRAEDRRRVDEHAKQKAQADREDRLRNFVLKEAPSLWRSYQNLGEQIATQARRVEELREALKEFDRNPEEDPDLTRMRAMQEEMLGARMSLRRKIEEAYLAYLKFEATPGRKEYDELRRRILDDGVREADRTVQRFSVMRESK